MRSSGDIIAIPGPIDGVYHFFNPLYKQNSLLGTQAMMHGVSNKIEGRSQPSTASANRHANRNSKNCTLFFFISSLSLFLLMACPSISLPCASYETGPYDWFSKPNPPIGGSNPAFVTYNDSSSGTTKYTLWVGGKIHSANSVDGPYTVVGSSPCGSNPVRPARPFLSSFSFLQHVYMVV